NMAQILVSDDARRKNRALPTKLYVEVKQTSPDDLKSQPEFAHLLRTSEGGAPCFSYQSAIKWSDKSQLRLPSAAGYEAIVGAVEHGEAQLVKTGLPVTMNDLFDAFPELSTTTKMVSRLEGNGVERHLDEMHVLKGFAKSPPELRVWVEGQL